MRSGDGRTRGALVEVDAAAWTGDGRVVVGVDAATGAGDGRAGVCLVGENAAARAGDPVEAAPGSAGERGQASVELLGALPALIAVALIATQMLAVGYAKVLAGAAAEAGALALVAGGDARAGVREALPGWSRAGAEVAVERDRVEVRLRPPSLLDAVGRALTVEAAAEVRLP